MRQLNGIYPVASDALYSLQIGVTAYCIPCCTRTGRIPSSPGDLYGAIDSKYHLILSSSYEAFCNFPAVRRNPSFTLRYVIHRTGVTTDHHVSRKMRLWEVLNDLLRRFSPFTMSAFHIVAEVLAKFSLTTSNQFFKSSSSFAMFIPVFFRSGFIFYMKGSIGLYFEFLELIVCHSPYARGVLSFS